MYDSAAVFGIRVVRDYGHYQSCICPYHDDHKPSAQFIKADGVFYCHGCGTRKTLAQLAADRGIELEAIEAGSSLTLPTFVASDDEINIGYPKAITVPEAMDYLIKRHVYAGMAMHYDVEWNERDKAINFPHYNIWGVRMGNVGRRTQGEGERYAVVGRREPLWPYKLFKIDAPWVFVSEGPFKAMRTWDSMQRVGVEGISLCTFGTRQISQIWSLIDQCYGRVVFVADPDKAGIDYGGWWKRHSKRVVVPPRPFDEATDEQCDRYMYDIVNKRRSEYAL